MSETGKVAIFSEAFDTKGQDRETCLARVGRNTGNLAFFRGIQKLFQPDFLRPKLGLSEDPEKLSPYSAFLTTDLIWITQNQRYESTERILDRIGDRPLIPVSIGLQCRGYEVDFQLHPDTVRLLHRLEERCVMGVRGNYTAEILSRYGLRNFQVIGCPSVFFRGEYAFDSCQPPTPETTVCNYKTFWGGFRPGELTFLEYCRKYQLAFVEQTCQTVEEVLGEKSGPYQEWLNQKKQLFFSLEEWDRFLQQFSFCLGMRFHGNVLAMQSGARALYLVSDSRTRELTEFFHFPSLEIGAFDPEKSLEAYWEMARYEEFTKVFPEKQENLREFAKKNGLIVNL